MSQSETDLQAIQATLDARLSDLAGFVGTGIGLSRDGRRVVKVYTSVPTKNVVLREPLPDEAELEYVGDIEAQEGP